MLNCIDPAVFFYSSADYFGPTWDRIKSIELRASSKASNDLFRRLQQITSNVSQTGSRNNATDKRCFFPRYSPIYYSLMTSLEPYYLRHKLKKKSRNVLDRTVFLNGNLEELTVDSGFILCYFYVLHVETTLFWTFYRARVAATVTLNAGWENFSTLVCAC